MLTHVVEESIESIEPIPRWCFRYERSLIEASTGGDPSPSWTLSFIWGVVGLGGPSIASSAEPEPGNSARVGLLGAVVPASDGLSRRSFVVVAARSRPPVPARGRGRWGMATSAISLPSLCATREDAGYLLPRLGDSIAPVSHTHANGTDSTEAKPKPREGRWKLGGKLAEVAGLAAAAWPCVETETGRGLQPLDKRWLAAANWLRIRVGNKAVNVDGIGMAGAGWRRSQIEMARGGKKVAVRVRIKGACMTRKKKPMKQQRALRSTVHRTTALDLLGVAWETGNGFSAPKIWSPLERRAFLVPPERFGFASRRRGLISIIPIQHLQLRGVRPN